MFTRKRERRAPSSGGSPSNVSTFSRDSGDRFARESSEFGECADSVSGRKSVDARSSSRVGEVCDFRTITAELDTLSESISDSYVSGHDAVRLNIQVNVIRANVIKWGAASRPRRDARQEFWADWDALKGMFTEINSNNDMPEIMISVRRHLATAENSVKKAAETLIRRPAELSECVAMMHEALTYIDESEVSGVFSSSARAIRGLHRYMNTVMRHVFAKVTTKRFDYAMHCITRALDAIMGIPPMQAMRSDLLVRFESAEQRLACLVADEREPKSPKSVRVKRRRRKVRHDSPESGIRDDRRRCNVSPLVYGREHDSIGCMS